MPKFNDLNLGIILICVYIILEFGSIAGLYNFLNYKFKLPLIIAAAMIAYALFLFATRKVSLKSGFAKTFTVMCLFILGYTMIATELPSVREGLLKSFTFYLSAYFVSIASIKRLSQFILIIDVWLASILFSSFHGIMQGGLVWSNKWFADENELALLASIALPYALTFLLNHQSKLKRVCYLLCILFFCGVTVVAHSRGGMLSIASVLFFFWLLKKGKLRNFILILFIVILSLNFAPPVFFEEMASLKQGTEEATAASRIYFWEKGFEMLHDYPFFGVGPQNYPFYFPQYDGGERYSEPQMRPPHSFPLQWLAEMGCFGFAILLFLQMMLFRNWKFRKIYREKMALIEDQGDIEVLINFTHAAAIAQIAFWVGSLFLSLMQYPFYWFIIYFSDCLRRIMETRIAEEHTQNDLSLFDTN